eukprot:5271476-Amphidinium_carterae.1
MPSSPGSTGEDVLLILTFRSACNRLPSKRTQLSRGSSTCPTKPGASWGVATSGGKGMHASEISSPRASTHRRPPVYGPVEHNHEQDKL